MATLSDNLEIDHCPHCSITNPNLVKQHHLETSDHTGSVKRFWYVYVCRSCGGVITACGEKPKMPVLEIFPSPKGVEDDIPGTPRLYLQQALNSLHAPAGAVMLAASAVDAMIRLKGYADGNLNTRIKNAADDHVITQDMAEWAHELRLDANDQRHAGQAATLPTADDASRAVDFAMALAEILFVMPNRVKRGIRHEMKDG